MDWQPIETAPKIVTLLEAMTPALLSDGRNIYIGRIATHSQYGVVGGLVGHNGQLEEWHITHWMLLPAPPKGSTDAP